MKKLITLLEVSSSEFRTKLGSLGYSEKGSELTSGGNLNSDFLTILTQLLDEWKKSNPNCLIKFTSGNDSYHKTITKYVSRHTKGEAVDLTLDKSCHPAFITLLNTYKSKYNGFSFIDEYTNPTSKATGGHFHLSYRNGAPEGAGAEYSSSETDLTKSLDTVDGKQIADDAFDTAAQKMNQGFVTPLASFVAGGSQNESAYFKEKKLIKEIFKIKNLLK